MSSIKENLKTINGNIEKSLEKIKKSDRKVRLVAVSKTKPAKYIQTAYDCGQKSFGENYIQELVEKSPKLPKDIQWHFIGGIQSNKIKKLCSVENLYCVETIDRQKTARLVNKEMEKQKRKINIMVQVNTSKEDQKNGINPSKASDLVNYVLTECKNLNFIGLMTIGDFLNTNTVNQPDFQCLIETRELVAKKLELEVESMELSMGMSSDYQQAVEWGSTSIRVGSKIFGARIYN